MLIRLIYVIYVRSVAWRTSPSLDWEKVARSIAMCYLIRSGSESTVQYFYRCRHCRINVLLAMDGDLCAYAAEHAQGQCYYAHVIMFSQSAVREGDAS